MKNRPLFLLAAALLTFFTASTLRAQTNYVGSNSSGVRSNFTSGTNSYSATYVGYDVGANSNSLSVENTDTVLANSGVLTVGNNGASNSLVISNGGVVQNSSGTIGSATAASNNSVLVTGTGSLWTNSSPLKVGDNGAGNSLVVSNAGRVLSASGFIGNNSTASNNSVLVTETGSFWSNSSGFYVGYSGASSSLVISNGGIVQNAAGTIGFNSASSNNSVLVTGASSRWTNTSVLTVGSNGTANSLVISAGGSVRGSEVNLGGGTASSNNSVLVTGSNSSLFSTNSLRVGYRSSGNSLVVSNGGAVTTTGTASIGNSGTAAKSNSLTVTGSGSTFAASTDINVSWDDNTGNRLLVLDGANVTAQNLRLSASEFGTLSSSNSVLISGSSGGVASTVTLSGNVYVGFGGRDNSLTISNGGRLLAANSFIGYSSSALRHDVLVTGTGSTWSNSGGLTLGRSGSGTLTVADGGSVAATDILIGQNNTSAGTLNIGRFGTNDAAGTISGPLLRFGNSTNAPRINFNQSNSTTVSAAISGNGTVNQLGSGTTTLTGSNSYSRGTTISAGTLQVGDGGTNGLLGSGAVTNNASLIVNRSDALVLSNVISGTGRFTKAGAGTLLLSASNSYSGGTWISGGTLTAGNLYAFGSGAVTIGLNTFLNLSNYSIANTLTNNGGTILNAGTISGGDFTGGTTDLSGNNSTVAEVSGTATVNVSGSGTTISNVAGGTVNVNGASTTIQSYNGGNIAVGSGLIVAMNDGNSSGVISGNGGMTKNSAGTLTLGGVSTYTGATTVGSGLLVVNGSIASSPVTIQSGGTLGGSGTVGDTTVESGGTINPGNSPGTLNINGDIDWLGGGNYNWQIAGVTGTAGTVSTWDLVSVTGILDLTALNIGSEYNINLWSLSSTGPDVDGDVTGFDNTQNYTWKIATAAGGITGFNSSYFNLNTGANNGTAGFANALNGGTFSLAQSGNDLNLVFTAAPPIPEPGTWAAAALLAGGAAFMRWRKRKQVS